MSYKNIVVAEQYEKDGEKKTKFTNIGKVFTKDDGKQSIKLDLIPLNWDGWASIMDPKPRQNGQSQQEQRQAGEQSPF